MKPVDFYAEADRQSAQVIQIETIGKGGIAAVLICVLTSCVALAYAMRAADRAHLAEREARVAQDKIQYFQIELVKNGLDVSQH